MDTTLRTALAAVLDETLVDELLTAYLEAKRNHHLGGHRLSAVEGGRFCEAAYRILEEITTGSFTSLNVPLRTDNLANRLAQQPVSSFPDSIRLHIPRALRVIYDIRNRRDAAHLRDGIDANLQDSTLVVGLLDWVLAEFVRLYHSSNPKVAEHVIAGLVTRGAPVVEDFDGFLKVLNPKLPAGDHCLVLLYQRDHRGATLSQLREWARPSMRANLTRTLRRLEHERAFVHGNQGNYRITATGKQEVERRHLLTTDESD